MTDATQLGLSVQQFHYRNPLRFLLLLLPASTILYAIFALGSRSNDPPPTLMTRVIACTVAVLSIALYMSARKRLAPGVFAEIYERGVRYKARAFSWSQISHASTASFRGSSIIVIHPNDASHPVEIHTSIYGCSFSDALLAELQLRAMPIKRAA